jgi:prepilin-type N-terminal cleavage/methylation domain-containing protein
MKKNFQKKGFTLVEMIGVVALLSILTAGAVVGLMQQRSNTSMGKLLQCLSAVDQAKQSWQMFNPNATFPSDEPSRWSAISVYLNTSAVQVSPVSTYGYNSYNGFFPSTQYLVLINGINTPCQAQAVVNGSVTSITRPL